MSFQVRCILAVLGPPCHPQAWWSDGRAVSHSRYRKDSEAVILTIGLGPHEDTRQDETSGVRETWRLASWCVKERASFLGVRVRQHVERCRLLRKRIGDSVPGVPKGPVT